MVLKMAHFRKSTGPRWVNYIYVYINGTNRIALLFLHVKQDLELSYLYSGGYIIPMNE